ncbi:MAG: hypothetical protein AUJ92_21695 [Armatimonadetes bacterium CG2_30_59_28]|nr:DUF348 domain-containing protein [Armatimonadota bacterium]OIO89345.1 MAG: hypothetical protein AUJ92_21695 [Armatimonadetes bacterium CG2_30_59_28]
MGLIQEQHRSPRLRAGTIATILGLALTILLRPEWLTAESSESCQKTPNKAGLSVWLSVDGQKRRISTTETTVEGLLQEQKVALTALDRASPPPSAKLHKGLYIKVVRIERATVERAIAVRFETIYKFSHTLRPGTKRTIKEGIEGEGTQTVEVWKKNGSLTLEKVTRTRIDRKPADRVVLMGDRTLMPSRGGIRPRKVVSMHATGYSAGPRSCGKHADGFTSIGLRAGYGVAAVDPRVIPLGTRLFVEGYGFAVAADVGGAIKGNRIDLGYDSHQEAIRFGRRTVKVHILD